MCSYFSFISHYVCCLLGFIKIRKVRLPSKSIIHHTPVGVSNSNKILHSLSSIVCFHLDIIFTLSLYLCDGAVINTLPWTCCLSDIVSDIEYGGRQPLRGMWWVCRRGAGLDSRRHTIWYWLSFVWLSLQLLALKDLTHIIVWHEALLLRFM